MDSFYMNDSKEVKIYNGNNNNNDKAMNDLTIHDTDDQDSVVVLRRHNRKYLHSFSTVSYDAMSSDDDNETLDILYPLPHVNTHERSFNNSNGSTDDSVKPADNGMIKKVLSHINYAEYWYSCAYFSRDISIR